MELNNRFDILASSSTDQESDQSFSIDVKVPEKIPENIRSTRNIWEVPDYVEKVVPCVVPMEVREQPTPSVTKVKKSQSDRKQKPTDYLPPSEEKEEQYEQQQQQIDVQSAPIAEEQQSVTHAYYPPQPHKFKPSAASKCLIVLQILSQFLLTNSSSK